MAKKKRTDRSDEQKKAIIAAFDHRKPGESVKDLAKKLGVADSLVDKWRKKLNMPRSTRGELPLDVIPDRPTSRPYKKKASSGDVRKDVARDLMSMATKLLSESE